MYIDLYNYIKDNHYIHVFHVEEYKYCDIGEYSYWIMDDDIDSSEIINRAKKVSKTWNSKLPHNGEAFFISIAVWWNI